MPIRRYLLAVLAIAVLWLSAHAGHLPARGGGGDWLVAPALADDDDGGGGGSGGANGSDGGSHKVFKKLKRKAPRKKPSVAASFAPRELIARNVSAGFLPRIEQLGYRILGRHTMAVSPNLVLRLGLPRGKGLPEARAEIAALAEDIAADPNHYYRLQTAGRCSGRKCSQFTLIGWSAPVQACDARLLIGMIDTPVNTGHAVLAAAEIETLSLLESGVKAADGSHGTAIAALLVGSPASDTPGLLPGARLLAINVFHRGPGNAERADAFSLVGAIEMLRERGIRIINMSLAGPPNAVLEQAVAAAAAAHVVMVAAAGNSGPKAKPSYPAAYDGVIAVTAVDRRNRIYRRAGQGNHIDIAAPGVDVWSASHRSGSRLFTGSSFATPFVAAAAALLVGRQPQSDASAVERQLAAAARDLGRPGRDPVFGAGLVQLLGTCH